MALLLTAEPAVEPVTLTEAKAYMRVDAAEEDALIDTLIASARSHVERTCALALITQGWSLFLDEWPGRGVVRLPLAPVIGVSEVRVHDEQGGYEILPAADYFTDAVSRPARVVVTGQRPKPGVAANGIEIAFTAGFGAAGTDVPEAIRQAILMLVAHGFERREPAAAEEAFEMPMTVKALLAPWRELRL